MWLKSRGLQIIDVTLQLVESQLLFSDLSFSLDHCEEFFFHIFPVRKNCKYKGLQEFTALWTYTHQGVSLNQMLVTCRQFMTEVPT